MNLDVVLKCAGFLCPALYRPTRVGFGTIIRESQIAPNVIIGRYSRVYSCRLDRRVSISSFCRLLQCQVGSYTSVGIRCDLARMTIGKFCSIAPEFTAGHGEHPTDRLSVSPVFYSTKKQCGVSFAEADCFDELRPIVIGNDVWIGARVFVRDGVRIGTGAIVGAGAVVTKDVADYSIVGGVPARLIRYRFSPDEIESLLRLKWWEWDDASLQKAAPLMRGSNVKALQEWAAAEGSFPDASQGALAFGGLRSGD
jgi:chloramphenicol O-acetyltransferase type B